jgi:hypothetical protein
MEKETLGLKQLKGYLGTGLKFQVRFKPQDGFDEKIVIDRLSTISEEENCITFEGASDFYFKDPQDNETEVKPILFNLSSLTKEIEVNGEKFVPIYKLFEIEYEGTLHLDLIREMYFKVNYTFTCSSHYSTAMETSINTRHIQMNNYWKIEKLYEWKFDVHGLIEKGLAIDASTLTENPYK